MKPIYIAGVPGIWGGVMYAAGYCVGEIGGSFSGWFFLIGIFVSILVTAAYQALMKEKL